MNSEIIFFDATSFTKNLGCRMNSTETGLQALGGKFISYLTNGVAVRTVTVRVDLLFSRKNKNC